MANNNSSKVSITPQATKSKLERAGTSDLLIQGKIKSILRSDFTLSAASGVQSAFPTSQDAITLEANTTYLVRGRYFMTTGTTTTKTTAIAFLAGGGLTIVAGGFRLAVRGFNVTENGTATATNGAHVAQLASSVITATATTGGVVIEFEGTMRTNAGGTITPQINFSANPGGTNLMKQNSFIEFIPEGTGSFVSYGPVS